MFISKKISLITDRPQQEVVSELKKLIDNGKHLRITGRELDDESKKFKGTLGTGTFNIQRIIHYKNAFLPHIKGKISNQKNPKLTLIKLEYSLSPFTKVFLILWSTLFIPVSIFLVTKGEFIYILAATGFLIIVYLIFLYEVKTSTSTIAEAVGVKN